MSNLTSTALWAVAKGQLALRTESLRARADNDVLVRALYSGVSRGTERLVLTGAIPESEHERMRCPLQDGSFPFPVKYGYCLVGQVLDGPSDMVGTNVFCLHPHQDLALVPSGMAVPIPPELAPHRAVLAANMETALNINWDSGIAPGDRVLIVGAGVVGLLTASLAAAIPGTDVFITDIDASKAGIADAMGAMFCTPGHTPDGFDICINTSGSAAGLRLALAKAGLEARVVEASWYGTDQVPLPLGEAFHSQRLSLISSQVGRIPPARQPRWTHRRRLEKAMQLLTCQAGYDSLLTHSVPFANAAADLPTLICDTADALCIAIDYTAED